MIPNRSVGMLFQEEYSNLIIEAYVDELIKDKQYLLIAYYVSKLPSDAQVHWYAKFLEGKISYSNKHPVNSLQVLKMPFLRQKFGKYKKFWCPKANF